MIALIVMILLSCEQKNTKVNKYRSGISVEATVLTLYPEGAFELSIHADYFSRTTKGKYKIIGDTLVLNSSKRQISLIDSVVGVQEPSIQGRKIIELYKRNFEYGFGQLQSDTVTRGNLYSERLYLNNDTDPVEFLLDSTGIAFIADSIEVTQIRYCPINSNNCQTMLEFTSKVENSRANLIKVYLNDQESEAHYLKNWKWLIRGDTIFNYYIEDCEPNKRIYLKLDD